MEQIFPYANVVAGLLVLVIGFGAHFVGQLISVVDWDLATRLGLQEASLRPEYRHYEHAIAMSDVLVGWTYGIAAVGLIIDAPFGYLWAWLPGAILTYHSIGFLFWTGHHKASGDDYATTRAPLRHAWAASNLATGLLTLAVAASQTVVE